MTQATATEPLADVQEGDWLIREYPHPYANCALVEPIRGLRLVTRRTKRLIWLGGAQYRLSGNPVGRWAFDTLRLPEPGEVDELQRKGREETKARKESGKEYAHKRERFISLMYQAARSRERTRFEELLAYWEVGNWDEELDRIDQAKAAAP